MADPIATKIVCTIGPASNNDQVLREMMQSGMSVARLNLSFGDQAANSATIERLRRVSAELGQPVAILADLQGPKLRVGKMPEGGVPVREGEEVMLTIRPVTGRPGEIPVQFQRLPEVVRPGDRILIDEGIIELRVLATTETDIRCQVVSGGTITTNKGMNLPRADTSIPAITEKDMADLSLAIQHGVDWVALSFVRHADEVRTLRALIREQAKANPPPVVMAKIEKPEAMENIDSIIEAADGIMVARGDLGIEAPPEEVPIMQKLLISKCNLAGKPVITATQMLESMIYNPRPTRAEANDVANAILDGSDAVMLSGESAAGKYPVRAVQTMCRIAAYTERQIRQSRNHNRLPELRTKNIAEAVSHAAYETARDLDAAAIITPTVSGYTARIVSKYRPSMPIVAITPSVGVQRQLCLYWGVHPLLARRTTNTDEMITDAVALAREQGYVKPQDLVVIAAGAAGSPPGTTNLIQVRVV